MPARKFQWLSGFGSKIAAINIVLTANAVVWYASILMVLENNIRYVGEESWLDPNGQMAIWALHFAALILSALVGAKISKRVNRTKFLLAWMTLNALTSLTLFALNYTDVALTSCLVVLYGALFGFGMPTCMSNYSDSVPIENRGRISGITMLVSGIGIFTFAAAPLNAMEMGLVLSLWRLASIAIFLASKSSAIVEGTKKDISFKNVLGQRSFLAYYIPWVLFSFVNFLVPLQPTASGEVADTTLLIQTVFLGASALVGGFMLDTIGRKRIAIGGFVMLGLSAAVRGIDSTILFSMYFSAVFEGIAWGLLLVLFILTLWGDLSDISRSEKYYALGATPFFVSMFIAITVGKQIENALPTTALFPFAAFFLFVAVLPLFYATETLPEKITQKRQLESYLKKALEKAKQETEKDKKEESKNKTNEDEKGEEPKESPEDEEARKLAEKYY